jgi:hypothetical protein
VRLAFALAWWDVPAAPTAGEIDAPTRASLLLAIVVIALIGLMLMAWVVVAARVARKKLRRPSGPTPLRRDEWTARPKVPADASSPPDTSRGPTGEDSA